MHIRISNCKKANRNHMLEYFGRTVRLARLSAFHGPKGRSRIWDRIRILERVKQSTANMNSMPHIFFIRISRNMKISYFSSTKNLHMQKTKCFQKSIFFNFYYIKYAESDMEKSFALTIHSTRASSIDFLYKWKINIFHQQKKLHMKKWKFSNFNIF